MNQIEALQRLRTLATPVVETRDVAALLQVSASNATTILRRLAAEGMIVHLSRGRWLVNQKIDRLALPELMSAPYPAYISLQSALFHHGVIEQIGTPQEIYRQRQHYMLEHIGEVARMVYVAVVHGIS